MANREHVAILSRGTHIWNEWRKVNADTTPDLSGEYLFIATELPGSIPKPNELGPRKLKDPHALWEHLIRADLSGVDFSKADLEGACVSHTKLARSNLRESILRAVDFQRSILRGADLYDAYLRDANLRDSDLTDANLSYADLTGADLRGADLSGASLSQAQMRETILGNNDLSLTGGLEMVRHSGPSTIGIEAIYRSKGKIPETFLKGAGVPEDFIVYMRSLVASPIEFYSCFISYSTRDEEFAERLHAHLQRQGVRCWFAPEYLKIGDPFPTRIEESIRIYDKLLLILSENSINSAWVEREVQAAFEKEQRKNRLALFPIRLDEAVMETDRAWAAAIRRTRHIGDFRQWKDPDSFKKAFQRLLRDLKPESPAFGG